MKRITLIILILNLIVFGQCTYRFVSDGSEISPGYTIFIVHSNPPTSYTVWGNAVHHFIDPVCWSKIIHRDGAQWISISRTGRVSWLGSYTIVRNFTLPTPPPPPATDNLSRATIWLAVDDVCTLYVNGLIMGCVNGFEHLSRIDITDFVVPGSNTITFKIVNTRPSFTGLIYYISVDYGKKISYTESYPCRRAGWWYRSIPLKIDTFIFPNLSFVFTGTAGPFIAVYDPTMPTSPRWRFYNINTPLVGKFADSIRQFSFFVLMNSGGREHIEGWPIVEQRYLDLQPYVKIIGSTDHKGWEAKWYPIGTIQPCVVPFDWRVGGPDDEPDIRTWWITGETDTVERCFMRWLHTYTLIPFKGYLTSFNDYIDPDPYKYANAHLDITCRYFRSSYNTNTDDFTNVEPDTEIIIPPYDSSDVDTSHPAFPDTSIRAPKYYIKYQSVPEPLMLAYPNPFNREMNFFCFLFKNDKISLVLYDIRGNFVKNIFTGNAKYGNNIFLWDGRDEYGKRVSTGLYIYKFKYGNGEYMGTILYIK